MLSRLLLALTALVAVAATTAPTAAAAQDSGRPEYSLLQMNLCLSGLAGCYPRTQYPAVVDEGIAKIRQTQPDAVTLNEACSGDVERIARETGYDHRFATVIYNGAPLPCRNPGDRGVFGNAVLTRATITSSQDAPFVAQSGAEQRRWICVRTTDAVRACTSHLSTRGSAAQQAANDGQCRELALILEGGPRDATIFGGDVNRRDSCGPRRSRMEADEEATQAPGIQHIYGTRPAFVRPRDKVLPMVFTDHDALLVRTRRLG